MTSPNTSTGGEAHGSGQMTGTPCGPLMSTDLFTLGEVEVAWQLSADTLARARRALGADHPHTRKVADNLATALRRVTELTHQGESDPPERWPGRPRGRNPYRWRRAQLGASPPPASGPALRRRAGPGRLAMSFHRTTIHVWRAFALATLRDQVVTVWNQVWHCGVP
jgi:hypothetical protein